MESPKRQDTSNIQSVAPVQQSVVAKSRSRTRSLVITAVLAAISILLSLTPLGYIPVPTAAGNATILQVPTILAAVLEGPLAGGFVGLVFGASSFLHASNVWFKDPLVSVIPRILIGVISYFVYALLARGKNRSWRLVSLLVTGFVGSAVNTILVLGAVYLFFPVTFASLATISLVQGLPEAVVSAILTTAIVAAYLGIVRSNRKSRIS
ncbi:ECF transporter S component [Alicyclobacillus fodiniaquatilis]|jgi:uncharacterized membrane protein|uniref:ECF transporter S component n=1 Tax=Alicyclobacillus fodiniaquatilis TaxID=1661150 RepID=A0ABW4JAH6_9BACL